MANKLHIQKQVAVISALFEGNNIRATVRMTGVSKNTVTELLVDLGRACTEYQDKTFRSLKCQRIQCDEIWSFCYAKDKNVPEELKGQPGVGSVWTWTALCPDTKLIPCWFVGDRSAGSAYHFIHDLKGRLEAGISDHVWPLEEIVQLISQP